MSLHTLQKEALVWAHNIPYNAINRLKIAWVVCR